MENPGSKNLQKKKLLTNQRRVIHLPVAHAHRFCLVCHRTDSKAGPASGHLVNAKSWEHMPSVCVTKHPGGSSAYQAAN